MLLLDSVHLCGELLLPGLFLLQKLLDVLGQRLLLLLEGLALREQGVVRRLELFQLVGQVLRWMIRDYLRLLLQLLDLGPQCDDLLLLVFELGLLALQCLCCLLALTLQDRDLVLLGPPELFAVGKLDLQSFRLIFSRLHEALHPLVLGHRHADLLLRFVEHALQMIILLRQFGDALLLRRQLILLHGQELLQLRTPLVHRRLLLLHRHHLRLQADRLGFIRCLQLLYQRLVRVYGALHLVLEIVELFFEFDRFLLCGLVLADDLVQLVPAGLQLKQYVRGQEALPLVQFLAFGRVLNRADDLRVQEERLRRESLQNQADEVAGLTAEGAKVQAPSEPLVLRLDCEVVKGRRLIVQVIRVEDRQLLGVERVQLDLRIVNSILECQRALEVAAIHLRHSRPLRQHDRVLVLQ